MRLFVAVPLPEKVKKKLAELGKEIEQDGIKLVEPENIHITLKFIGESSEAAHIEKKLREIRFNKFACAAKGAGVFPNENYIRVVWAGLESEELNLLAKKVIGALHGYGKDDRFSAHVTIARVKQKIDLKSFLEKHKDEDFGSFEISSFDLMQSELGGDGPKYTTLASFQAEGKDA
ncbi:RNA 2',3'-cyclic phosphodiesterase [Candidatus Micrarchaeota archaeon]|nr:RNA 2',3'-cyclic phosphodiesterase [Candidatus Micrarchaeota archaeon]